MSATSRARLRAARDHPRVVDDLVDGYRQGAVGALHHHPEAVADQQHVDAGLIEDAGERKVVSRQHRDRHAGRFHLGQIGYANFVVFHTPSTLPQTYFRLKQKRSYRIRQPRINYTRKPTRKVWFRGPGPQYWIQARVQPFMVSEASHEAPPSQLFSPGHSPSTEQLF